MSLFSLDAVAWLTEHNRRNAELIERASTPRTSAHRSAEAERPAPALQPQVVCC